MQQIGVLAVIAMLIGLIGWFWLGSNNGSESRDSADSSREPLVSLGSRMSMAATVALVCALASIMVPFLVVFAVGVTGQVWVEPLIWIIYLSCAIAWVSYSFLSPKKTARK